MARKVFYSFHYANDISRVMVVRNHWVTNPAEANSIIDKAEFEEIKRQGDQAVKRWINKQLNGTSVTVVLIGAETLNRPFVKYEICESLRKGNAIIGVYIHKIKNFEGKTSLKCDADTIVGYYNKSVPIFFDVIADAIYDYVIDDGYHNLGKWVEQAAQNHVALPISDSKLITTSRI